MWARRFWDEPPPKSVLLCDIVDAEDSMGL